jgi:hypothetical protein
MTGSFEVELVFGDKYKRNIVSPCEGDDFGNPVWAPLLLDEKLLNAARGAAEDLDNGIQSINFIHGFSARPLLILIVEQRAVKKENGGDQGILHPGPNFSMIVAEKSS